MTAKATDAVTITASDFHRLVGAVLPLADRGTSLPVLGAVLLRGHGEWLSATATDRYRAGMARHKVAAPEGWQAVVPVPALRMLLGTFKPTRRDDPALILTVEGDTLSVSTEGLAGTVGGVMRYRVLDTEYPKSIDGILRNALDEETALPPGSFVNPSFLADFRLAARGEPMRMSARVSNDGSPPHLVVRVGNHFVGVLMGVRVSGPASSPDPWAHMFPPAESVSA